jgi:hypothetical protein
MNDIYRYVLVDLDDTENDYEYQDFEIAKRDATVLFLAGSPMAVVKRTYVYEDTSLVWTPDGTDNWPPKAGS